MSEWTDNMGLGGYGPPIANINALRQMQAAQMPQAMVHTPMRYGHSEDALKDASKVQEFFYPEAVSDGNQRMLPQYKVASFRVGVGVKNSGSVNFPGEFYHTRGEAQDACAKRIREALVYITEKLVNELTHAALGQGLNADPELDVTDALRKYLQATKT